jgi:short-subunit dehydrogenase
MRRRPTLPPPSPRSTALVTGASSGIGVEIARSLARRGHGVTLAARRKERLEDLAQELAEAHGVGTKAIECDVTDPDSRAELVDRLDEVELEVEILVNNAGYGSGGLFHELELERELGMVRTNSEAMVAMCGLFVPGMVARGRGAVLNTASTIGFQPLPGEATYSASKAFALTFTESLHAELIGRGIVVTALCPGPVETEFMEDEAVADNASSLPRFMWVDPADVAEQGVRGLERGRRVVVPGTANRIGTNIGRHVNRGVLLAAARRVLAR